MASTDARRSAKAMRGLTAWEAWAEAGGLECIGITGIGIIAADA